VESAGLGESNQRIKVKKTKFETIVRNIQIFCIIGCLKVVPRAGDVRLGREVLLVSTNVLGAHALAERNSDAATNY
jgi:predicted double-glycine peptidase